MNILNSGTNQLLENAISASSLRQKTISQNIANIDTPNYKSKKTVFSHQLQNSMNNNHLSAHVRDQRHIPFGGTTSDQARVITRTNTQYNHNGNNVDIDLEMSEMAENQIYYNALIDRLNGKFNSINTVLGRGGN